MRGRNKHQKTIPFGKRMDHSERDCGSITHLWMAHRLCNPVSVTDRSIPDTGTPIIGPAVVLPVPAPTREVLTMPVRTVAVRWCSPHRRPDGSPLRESPPFRPRTTERIIRRLCYSRSFSFNVGRSRESRFAASHLLLYAVAFETRGIVDGLLQFQVEIVRLVRRDGHAMIVHRQTDLLDVALALHASE